MRMHQLDEADPILVGPENRSTLVAAHRHVIPSSRKLHSQGARHLPKQIQTYLLKSKQRLNAKM
jgi:hypothetical protein